MFRGKRLAVISHCVLNQCAVVHDLARARGALSGIVRVLAEAGLGIYQLPCPELEYGGLERLPQTYAQYDTAAYAAVVRQLTERVASDMDRFRRDGCTVELLLGIRHSPTCSFSGTVGHFYQLLQPVLYERFPDMKAADVPEDETGEWDSPFCQWLAGILNSQTGRMPGM